MVQLTMTLNSTGNTDYIILSTRLFPGMMTTSECLLREVYLLVTDKRQRIIRQNYSPVSNYVKNLRATIIKR